MRMSKSIYSTLHYYTVSLFTLMSNQYMYQISFVPLYENFTFHKTFKKSYQKLQNLFYNFLDKNYLELLAFF